MKSDMPEWLHNWRQRHRHPISFWLHVIGIPMTIATLPLVVVQVIHGEWHLWWRPVLLVTIGYLLQWIGHCLEGNDMGEMILIKRRMGKPYVVVSPRYAESSKSAKPGEEAQSALQAQHSHSD